MTDLEDRIRDSLRDPRRQLPDWPDPMPRIRRAARRQYAALAGAIAVLLAGVALPLALVSALGTHAAAGKPSTSTTPSPAPTRPARAAIPRYPAWTKGLRGEVAYECGYVLCLMHPDGSGKRGVPGNGRPLLPQWNVAWSPDGSRLSFRGYYGPGDGQYDLYAAGANGCHLTRLTHGLNGDSSSWSPSGRQIAVSAPYGLDLINANGTRLHQLVANHTNITYADAAPAWSVRNRIAFVWVRPAPRPAEIYTVNADGSRLEPLTHGGNGFGEPAWSPDGNSIAFAAGPDTFASSVVEVANADGTGVRRVSSLSWISYSPTWTPGGQIVFLRQTHPAAANGPNAPPATSAYIVNRDGSDLRLLYPNLNASQIAWGPATLPPAGC